MLTRFFLSLVWLLVASGAAAQSWHEDSRYVRLGPRSGYYIVRPGSHLSRQLALEGAPISDTADPFRHGYGTDALTFQFDRRSIAASPCLRGTGATKQLLCFPFRYLYPRKKQGRRSTINLWSFPQNGTTKAMTSLVTRDRSLQSV